MLSGMSAISRWINHSLGRRIAAMVALLVALTAGSLVAGFYFQLRRVGERTSAERLRLLAGQLSDMLGRAPAAAVAELNRAASDPSVIKLLNSPAPPGGHQAPAVLASTVRGETRRVVRLIAPDGTPVVTKGSSTQADWFGPEPEGLAERNPSAGVEVTPLSRTGDSTLYSDIRVPVRSENGVIWVIVERFLVAGNPTTAQTLAALLGDSTTLMIGAPGTGVWTDLAGLTETPPEPAMVESTLTHFETDGRRFHGYAMPVANTSWTLLVRSPEQVALAPARGFLRDAVILALIAIVVGAMGAVMIARRLNRPLREITEATSQIAAGDFSRRADERATGEIGRLARSFNAMANQVGESTRQLKESEASHRAFVSHASQGIWRVEFPEGADISLPVAAQIEGWYAAAPMADCNPVLAGMLDVETHYDLTQVPLERLFPRDDLQSMQVLQTFVSRGHRCSGVETRQQRNGDAPRIYSHDLIGIVENGRLSRIWGTRRDVTVERFLDERIAQSQRLESVGRLAGGIAHDFNNLLTVILADTESIRSRLGEQDGEAKEIDSAARRAADLTRQLLAFSRGQVLRPTTLDLNAVVTSFESMLRRVIGEDITLKLKLDAGLDPVEADSGQIERVIMNLVVNARDAMPRGGTVEIRTERVTLDEEYVRGRPGVHAGRYVLLAVSDTGAGMSEEVQKRAFEPFFTTKSKGRGTGLGLASVYGVVRQSGGDISLYSELGRGTSVKILLPASSSGAAAEHRPRTVVRGIPAPAGATVLLVEDDPAVRRLVHRSLGSLGYRVLDAKHGEQALEIAEREGGNVDVVLTDMIMPGMNGVELVGKLRSQWPGMGIVMMSGYTGDTYVDLDFLPSDIAFLEKPFAVADLQRLVRDAVEGTARVDESE